MTPRTRPYLIAAESARKTPRRMRRDHDGIDSSDASDEDDDAGCGAGADDGESGDLAALRYYLERSALKPRHPQLTRVVL